MKRYTKITIIKGLAILFAGCWIPLRAQDNIQLINLETVLELGGANNLIIQEYKHRQELAIANLAKEREWWLPDIRAGATTHQLWGSAMTTDGTILTGLDRQYFWTGAGLSASWNFGEGIYNAKSANLQSQSAMYLTQAERNKALLEIIQTYYDFQAAQFYFQSYGQLVVQADTISAQIAVQVESGFRYESELLLARSNSNHLKVEMLNARKEYSIASAKLTKLLNLGPSVRLVSTDTALIPLQLMPDANISSGFDSVYLNRPEIKREELMVKSLQAEKKTTTTGLLLPELRIGTYGSYFGDVFSPLYPTGEINAALVWKIPLGRLIYGGDLKQYNSQIAIRQVILQQTRAEVSEEVTNAKELLHISKVQIEMAEEGNRLAGEALLQSMQRQSLGTVRPFEILQAQEVYIKTRLDYLTAVSDYNKAQYALYLATGKNL
ncbi:MAG TPA: TolC family protein [Bacteroides sp.]|nr:TolC family protein [Bacteroides sp.]